MSWETPGAVIQFLTTLVRCWCLSGDKHSSTPEAGVERRSSFYSYLEKKKIKHIFVPQTGYSWEHRGGMHITITSY